MSDARFEDAREAPLHLKALDAEDLPVLSALAQDAVFPVTEIKWQPSLRRFALLLNRFRWEDEVAISKAHQPERVQSLLVIGDVLRVQSQGVNRAERDLILSLLAMAYEAGEDGAGRLVLTLAGDGAIALDVEALDVTLKDVTKPYVAPSRKVPHHSD